MGTHTFDPGTQEAIDLSSKPSWYTQGASGQPALHSESLSQKEKGYS